MIFGMNKAYSYEDAFKATDCTSDRMKLAISEWFNLFFDTAPNENEDPCQRIPYTVVNKLTKTAFGEYTATGSDEFTAGVLDALNKIYRRAMHDALTGGIAFLKPFPIGDRFVFSSISRANMLIFGRDVEGNPTDVGTAERTAYGSSYYTLLERRTIGTDGLLTIQNKLYRSQDAQTLGNRVPLATLERYAPLQDEYKYPEPVGLGMVPLVCPVPNCVDGGPDPVSVYAAAVGLIHNINRNEYELSQEFENGRSRVIASSDMLKRREGTNVLELKDTLFVGLDDDPENTGITIFSPQLREASFLARKTEYLRNVESVIGLKRGMLSEVEAMDKTATEVTSSAGDFNLTVIDFQRMWETAAKQCAVLCGKLGRLYNVTGARDVIEDDVTIDWGNGVLYDEDKTWEDYKDQVARGLIKPEIALGWRYNMPTDTPADLQKIRARYMPEIDTLMREVEA